MIRLSFSRSSKPAALYLIAGGTLFLSACTSSPEATSDATTVTGTAVSTSTFTQSSDSIWISESLAAEESSRAVASESNAVEFMSQVAAAESSSAAAQSSDAAASQAAADAQWAALQTAESAAQPPAGSSGPACGPSCIAKGLGMSTVSSSTGYGATVSCGTYLAGVIDESASFAANCQASDSDAAIINSGEYHSVYVSFESNGSIVAYLIP